MKSSSSVQKFECANLKCKGIVIDGKRRAGPGVVKEFKNWSPVGSQLTPGCIACDKPMKRSEAK
jgi:hypothetical protein